MSQTTVSRVDPQEVRAVRAGDVINFTLPRGVLDLRTLRMWALATITGGTATNQALPRDVETLIDTLTVWVGDQMVQYTPNYNLVARATLDFMEEDLSISRGMLSNGLGIADGLGSAAYTVSAQPICFAEWLGFLGCKELVDTRRAPVRFQITLAPNNVLVVNSAAASYTLADVHLTVTCDSSPKGLESQRAKNGLSDGSAKREPSDALEFDNWRTTVQHNAGFAQQTQLNVSTRQLDLVLGTFVPADYRQTAVSAATGQLATSLYFTRGTASLPDALTWNFRVDGKRVLQSSGTVAQAFEHARTLLGRGLSGMTAIFVRRRDSGVTTRTLQQLGRACWLAVADAGGSDLREVDADVVFETDAPTGNTPVMSLLAARFRSRLTWNADTGAWAFEP